MADAYRPTANVPRERYDWRHEPSDSASDFAAALERARDGDRLTVDDATELLTTGTDAAGIDGERKRAVLDAADRRRRAVVGDDVTFVANLNNNVTTACTVGCLFCNFKDPAAAFETDGGGAAGEDDAPSADGDVAPREDAAAGDTAGAGDGAVGTTAADAAGGFTKTVEESRDIVADAVDRGVYEVCSVSGLHPALALDEDHREALAAGAGDARDVTWKPPSAYRKDPGTYAAQIRAMASTGAHVHAVTPEEASHARRGTDRSYAEVYARLADAGLASVPGTAAEILVDEVRDAICPGKIDTQGWLDAMAGAAAAGLDTTATIMYGHVENERHRALHLDRVRALQDRTGAITEFVPLSFVHPETPLAERGMVDGGASRAEDELMVAVSRLFLDNVEHVQSSWVKYGDDFGLHLLDCGADDFMGTILSEEITKRAGGDHGEFRSVADYVALIDSIGRRPVERTTDYRETRPIDPDDPPFGPRLGPRADGTPLVGE